MHGKKHDTHICEKFCSYYKPGKNELLACQGFVVARRLGGKRALQIERHSGAAPHAGAAPALAERLCPACAFFEGECDFVLTEGTALPCGGFILLSHLVGAGELTVEEIEEELREVG